MQSSGLTLEMTAASLSELRDQQNLSLQIHPLRAAVAES